MADNVSGRSVTRSSVECPIFGAPSELKNTVLPTIEDTMKGYLYVRHELKRERSGKEPNVSEISKKLGKQIEEIWQRASIPTVSLKRIFQLVCKHHNTYLSLIRYPKIKRNEYYNVRVDTFKNESTKLFDIAACKCQVFNFCSCHKSHKVPTKEQSFLLDQRSTRRMVIGTIDIIESSKLRKKFERKNAETGRLQRQERKCSKSVESDNIDESQLSIIAIPELQKSASDMSSATEPSTSKAGQMRFSLPTLSRMCDQYGISDRCAAAIASATLQDVGIVSKDDCSEVVDRSKIRRERQKMRALLQNLQTGSRGGLQSIFFDSRKDKTLSQEMIGDRYHRRSISEEHVSIIEEPNSLYLGHVTPASGTGKQVATAILDFCFENGLSLDDLLAVGCDGTATNTGRKNGAIAFLQNKVGRPLQWLICQLHANELPLRHLFAFLDGATAGPREYSGPIGKLLENCEKLSPVQFDAIACILPEIDNSDMSTDQKYLYEMCRAISSGQCSLNLSSRNPGKLSHSRWITAANRILRLYIGSECPSSNLKILVEYIANVYAPVWFQIKKQPSCSNGARHVFKTITLSRYLSDDLKNIIDPVIQRNAYFCHPENILLSMLTDERRHIKELALRRILKAREVASVPKEVREFRIPKLNFSASDYIDVINWSACEVTAPPILARISNESLQLMKSTEANLEFSQFPCHTQAVERCVKMVTEASLSVIGQSARDGFIRAKVSSRSIMPSFDTKKDFRVV